MVSGLLLQQNEVRNMKTNTKSQRPNIQMGDVIIAGWTHDGEVIQEYAKNAESLWRCFEIYLQGGTVSTVIPLVNRR